MKWRRAIHALGLAALLGRSGMASATAPELEAVFGQAQQVLHRFGQPQADVPRFPDQQSVVLGQTRYFIDRGQVLATDLRTGKTIGDPQTVFVAALETYQDALIVLQATGRVWIRYPHASKWLFIGRNAVQIRVAGKHLLALTQNSELWIFDGRPGTDVVLFGRLAAFSYFGISSVASLEPRILNDGSHDVIVRYSDGRPSIAFSVLAKTLPQ
jgi:hypothetical protein